MNILKVGDGPFTRSNVGIIQELFGKTVDKNRRGGGVYKIKENKFVSFIYLAIQQPNGNWTLPPEAPSNCWINKPNSNNSEFIRECYKENFKKRFTDPKDEYAIFIKKRRSECSFYGIFKFKEEKRDYIECIFELINNELNFEEWN